ncbi:hypothetical protein ACFLR9_08050 [Bacteroidota bacterium]
MKIDFNKFEIPGYLILLIVNAFEVRSGWILTICQLALGFAVFLPRLGSSNFLNNYYPFRPVLEFLYILSLLGGVYLNWFNAPNHFYLFIALSLLFIIPNKEGDTSYLRDNIRWIFIIVMGFATIHKLINPTFINGDFVGYMISVGGFLRPILIGGFAPEIKEILIQNIADISELTLTDPMLGKTVLMNTGNLPVEHLNKIFTLLIVGCELLLVLLFIFFPWRKFTIFSLLLFVGSIGLIVSEFEFASTLLFMGLLLCPSNFLILKKAFRYTFLIYSVSAILYNTVWTLTW